MNKLRVEITKDSDYSRGRHAPDLTLINLIAINGQGSEVVVMTETVSDGGGKTSYARAEERAEEIRRALGLLTVFDVSVDAGPPVLITAIDAHDAMERIVSQNPNAFVRASQITIKARIQ